MMVGKNNGSDAKETFVLKLDNANIQSFGVSVFLVRKFAAWIGE